MGLLCLIVVFCIVAAISLPFIILNQVFRTDPDILNASMSTGSYEEKEKERVIPLTYSTYEAASVTVVTAKLRSMAYLNADTPPRREPMTRRPALQVSLSR